MVQWRTLFLHIPCWKKYVRVVKRCIVPSTKTSHSAYMFSCDFWNIFIGNRTIISIPKFSVLDLTFSKNTYYFSWSFNLRFFLQKWHFYFLSFFLFRIFFQISDSFAAFHFIINNELNFFNFKTPHFKFYSIQHFLNSITFNVNYTLGIVFKWSTQKWLLEKKE